MSKGLRAAVNHATARHPSRVTRIRQSKAGNETIQSPETLLGTLVVLVVVVAAAAVVWCGFPASSYRLLLVPGRSKASDAVSAGAVRTPVGGA